MLFELLLGTPASGPICCHGNVENTDIITFVEGYEEEVCSILIGQWPEGVGQALWSLAEQCVEERSARPTSTEVGGVATSAETSFPFVHRLSQNYKLSNIHNYHSQPPFNFMKRKIKIQCDVFVVVLCCKEAKKWRELVFTKRLSFA